MIQPSREKNTPSPSPDASDICSTSIYWCIFGMTAAECTASNGKTQGENQAALLAACEDAREKVSGADLDLVAGCNLEEAMDYVNEVTTCAGKLGADSACTDDAKDCL